MVNIDLNNITHWAKQWLVKLNLEKTNCTSVPGPSPVDIYFSTDNIKIKPVDAHKHLGVTLSADGKWSISLTSHCFAQCVILFKSMLTIEHR
jgi:hypothetical protein